MEISLFADTIFIYYNPVCRGSNTSASFKSIVTKLRLNESAPVISGNGILSDFGVIAVYKRALERCIANYFGLLANKKLGPNLYYCVNMITPIDNVQISDGKKVNLVKC